MHRWGILWAGSCRVPITRACLAHGRLWAFLAGSHSRGLGGGRVLGARPQQVGGFYEAEEPQSPRGDRPHLAEELTRRTEPVMTVSRGLPAGHPQAPRPQRVLLTPTPPCISGCPPPSSQAVPSASQLPVLFCGFSRRHQGKRKAFLKREQAEGAQKWDERTAGRGCFF